jgi:tetratricopeptide (TPR) repeat protein
MTTMNFDKWRHYIRARTFELLGNHEVALSEYHEAFRLDSGFRKAANALAWRYASSERYNEAIRYFSEALKLKSGDAEAHYNLGFVYAMNHQPREAIERFRSAVELSAVLDMAWYGMGLAHAALGEHREAKEAFERAARLQPMAAPAWYQLGMACYHAHDPDRLHQVIHHLNRFDPRMARRLILETESTDLVYLVKDLVV